MTTGSNIYRVNLRGQYHRIDKRNNSSSIDWNFGTLSLDYGKSWVGSDNPLFSSLIERQLQATNPYSMKETKILYRLDARNTSDVEAYAQNYYSATELRHVTFGQGLQTPNWDASIITNNTNLATAKVYKKLARLQSDYGGFEFLAEFRKSLHMIKHPAESLAAYLNHKAERMVRDRKMHAEKLARIRRSRASRTSIAARIRREEGLFNKTVAKSWLELQFGAKPFIGSLEDIANSSVNAFPSQGAVKILSATSQEVVRIQSQQAVTFGRTTYDQTVEDEYLYEVTIKARVKYAGQYDGMSSLELMASRGGFKVSQIVPTLWELTPLSVFADYFVTVGDTLSALATETKDVFSVDRYVTKRLLRRSIISIRPVPYSIARPYPETRDGTQVFLFKEYDRTPWSLTIPPVRFTNPIGNFSQMANLSAFLYSLLR